MSKHSHIALAILEKRKAQAPESADLDADLLLADEPEPIEDFTDIIEMPDEDPKAARKEMLNGILKNLKAKSA